MGYNLPVEAEWNGGGGMSRWPAIATDPLLGGLPGSPEPATLQPQPHLSCSPLRTQAFRERKAAPPHNSEGH